MNHETEHEMSLYSRELILNHESLGLLLSDYGIGKEFDVGWQYCMDGNFLRDFWISMSTKDEFTKQLFTKLLLIVKTSYVNTITFVMIYHNVYVQRKRHLKNHINRKL